MPSSGFKKCALRSEEHTSELQSHDNFVCRLLLEKNKPGRPCATSCWKSPRPVVVENPAAKSAFTHEWGATCTEQSCNFFLLIGGPRTSSFSPHPRLSG